MLAVASEKCSNPEELVTHLLTLPTTEAQHRLLAEYVELLGDQLVNALKKQADQFLRSDIHRSFAVAELLLHIASLANQRLYRALGLLAQGNALGIGLGEYTKAMGAYDEALAIYSKHGCWVERARVEIGRIWALACLGQYEEAFVAGAWACQVLEEHGETRLLATATMNLAIIYCRHGEDAKALALLDRASDLCHCLGAEGEAYWAWVQQNRTVSLRNLGQFDAAIEASMVARQTLLQRGQSIEAARAQQNLAVTYYVLGRYNEALINLDQVYTVFRADGRQRDAMLVELFISDCLLQLRRFEEVLEKCQRVRELFNELGARQVAAQAIVNEAVAYIHLGRLDDALRSLQDAQNVFQEVGNQVWVAMTQLESAGVVQLQGKHQESLDISNAAAGIFRQHGLPIEEAHAHLIAARAALALRQDEQARRLLNEVIAVGLAKNIPSLIYHGYQLAGKLAEIQEEPAQALTQYERAIESLENLRGRLMLEYRANFLEDKESIYEEAVHLCLKTDQLHEALAYAERAKSRALLDLLAYRLDLSIQARQPEDKVLVDELTTLRRQRDQLYRRWESNEEIKLRGWTPSNQAGMQQQEILQLEKRITELWHKLLVHNADYARDAALWQVRSEPVQPYLPPETLLLEYFITRGELVAFLITADQVQVHRLGNCLPQIQQLLQLLQMNLKMASQVTSERTIRLADNARGLLQRLYRLLLAPMQQALNLYPKLLIVPHGPLHYLPFHALHDGEGYFIQRHEISYLPSASFLRYSREAKPATSGALIYGNSWHGKLPNTLHEVEVVANIFNEQALVEEEVTVAQLPKLVANARLVHLATHGDFRSDNPLFSGLTIGDGWLTTLDLFNLRLKASLVTLSGCQTGRNVVRGGDELSGLMRALLSAGAASLVLTLWSVEDQATARFMAVMYDKLATGYTKGAALQAAQLQFIEEMDQGDARSPLNHPYFWAPFFLVGDPGPL